MGVCVDVSFHGGPALVCICLGLPVVGVDTCVPVELYTNAHV